MNEERSAFEEASSKDASWGARGDSPTHDASRDPARQRRHEADRATGLQPVRAAERIVQLDVLRGLALFGVLAMNIFLDFSGNRFLMGQLMDEAPLSLDGITVYLLSVLVSGKAMAVFSFLFGLGFALQMRRAEERGQRSLATFARRMAVLLVIGLLHAVLLWYGDILTLYAVFGFILLAVRGWKEQTLLRWGYALALGLPLLLALVMTVAVLTGAAGGEPAETSPGAPFPPVLEELESGDPSRVFIANLQMLRTMWLSPVLLGHVFYLGMFLIGMVVGRRRLIESSEGREPALRRLVIAGSLNLTVVAVVSAVSILREAGPWLSTVDFLATIFGHVVIAAGYVALTLLLFHRSAVRRVLLVFAPVGRMALTNYIGQTVICQALFLGLGLVGRTGPAATFGMACVIFAGQIVFSRLWLERFRFGPLEWLWRSLTYGTLQPLRREAT